MRDSRVVLAFCIAALSGEAAVAQRPLSDAAPLLPPSGLIHQEQRVVAVGNADFLVTWSDGRPGIGISARKLRADGAPSEDHLVTEVNSILPGGVGHNSGGQAVVAWTDWTTGSPDCRVRRLGPDGTPEGQPLLLEEDAATYYCEAPDVALLEDSGFIAAFSGGAANYSTPTEVRVRRFASTGVPLGPSVAVGSAGRDLIGRPSIAADALGRFVVVWSQDDPSDNDTDDILGRRFAAEGTAMGEVFRVNTITRGAQASPRVAMSAGGAFVVTWDGPRPDGTSREVYARLFDSGGSPRGPELQVNEEARLWQYEAAVDMDSVGNFLVAWQSDWPLSGSGAEEIIARLFRADGRPLSDEFQVNAPSAMPEYNPDVALSDSGAFAVVYEFWEAYFGTWNVYTRRYIAGCPAEPAPLLLGQGRFEVCGQWETATSRGGAVPHPLTEDTGAFWFFSPENLEFLIKVLDGCGVNQSYWVYASGLTDVGVDVVVRDRWSGRVYSFSRPRGVPFQPLQSVGALPVCGAVPPPG